VAALMCLDEFRAALARHAQSLMREEENEIMLSNPGDLIGVDRGVKIKS
jgi:hypothetical protein